MRLHIRPGKVTCAGIVVIFMVLPNSIWKAADAKNAPPPKLMIEAVKPVKKDGNPTRRRVKFRKVPR
jgi:hypothetical protein